ncbi:MAG: HNH endonuclease signature motif containing protein [Pseudomonadota bacterium]
MDSSLRRFVRIRAGQRCEYCRLPQEFSELRFHIEHVIPRQHGGLDETNNLALACPNCNLRKGPNLTAVDPDTRAVVALYHPRAESWFDHFAYDGEYIVGISPTGRATVSLLAMNDPERTRIRVLITQSIKDQSG